MSWRPRRRTARNRHGGGKQQRMRMDKRKERRGRIRRKERREKRKRIKIKENKK